MDESRYKTNCDFETAIPHYIDGVGRKYIRRIGLRRFATPPNTEYIFSQLAVNIMRYCRLKIAISLYYSIRLKIRVKSKVDSIRMKIRGKTLV